MMKTRSELLFFIPVIAVIALGACRKQPAPRQQNPNSNVAMTQDAPLSGAATNGEKFYFRGRIAGNLRIEMTLLRDGESLTGSYFYPRVGKNIALSGTVDKDGNVSISESDDGGKQTGVFKGKWKPATDSPDPNLNEIDGKWSRPDGSKATAFLVSKQPIELTGAARLAPTVIKEANKQARFTIDAEYPQIE